MRYDQKRSINLMSSPLRILIADDHEIVREGLEAILSAQENIEIIGIAENGIEAVKIAEDCQPDVILMDLVMPEMDGLEAIKIILKNNPNARILVLTGFAEDEQVFPAIKAGALGYLLKDTPRDELMQAIQDVAKGQIALHPTIASRMVRKINQPDQGLNEIAQLTHREMETLRLIARGFSNQEIALQLGIHENTIAKYVSAILKKLQLTNRTQAALYALRKGLADL
jgi:NarL family two-component system response regulator LiaR